MLSDMCRSSLQLVYWHIKVLDIHIAVESLTVSTVDKSIVVSAALFEENRDAVESFSCPSPSCIDLLNRQ